MCASVKQLDGIDLAELLEAINRASVGAPEKEYRWREDMGIGDAIPVYTSSGPELMVWGYPRDDGKTVFNARTDNADWQDAMDNRRVIVRTQGFIERKHVNGKATGKYLFTHPDDRILNLAGVYVYRMINGQRVKRLLVHTMPPNESVENYHNRMPVSVPASEIDAYLKDKLAARDILGRTQPQYVAKPMGAEQLSMF